MSASDGLGDAEGVGVGRSQSPKRGARPPLRFVLNDVARFQALARNDNHGATVIELLDWLERKVEAYWDADRRRAADALYSAVREIAQTTNDNVTKRMLTAVATCARGLMYADAESRSRDYLKTLRRADKRRTEAYIDEQMTRARLRRSFESAIAAADELIEYREN